MRSVARFALACRSARSRRFIDMKASIKITIDAITRTKPMKYSDTEFMQSGFTPAPVSGLALDEQCAFSEWTRVMR